MHQMSQVKHILGQANYNSFSVVLNHEYIRHTQPIQLVSSPLIDLNIGCNFDHRPSLSVLSDLAPCAAVPCRAVTGRPGGGRGAPVRRRQRLRPSPDVLHPSQPAHQSKPDVIRRARDRYINLSTVVVSTQSGEARVEQF